jgi:NitT/TauT family transport system substrate-binding protein
MRTITLAAVGAFLALTCIVPRAALADDTLTVIGGSNPTAFYEVLDHVAERAGFFKDQHLTVNKQYAGNPSTCVQLVATGKGDICSMAFEPVLLGYERGLRFQFFLSRDPQFQHVLAVLDDSPIKTLADFKGADLGEISLGSAAEMGANSTLAGAGLKKSDYTFIPIGFGAQAIAALTTKKVAGAAFPYPELASYEVVAHLKFRYFWNPILRDIGNVGYAATPATIQNKSDDLRRFSRAIVQAAILTRVNPNLAARYFLEGAGIKVTDEALQNEARLLVLAQGQLAGADPANPKVGYIPPLGMEVYTKFLAANGITSVVVPVSAVVTNQFVDYANDFDRKAFIAQAKAMR